MEELLDAKTREILEGPAEGPDPKVGNPVALACFPLPPFAIVDPAVAEVLLC